MRKIDKILIENFQSHKKSEINFLDFSIIVGHTDSGKSAIIRAMKWCLYNTPDGTSFIKQGEEMATVTIIFTDGSSITRCRAKKKVNYYEINSDKGTLKLESFGTGPVKEVVDFHGMREVSFLGPRQSLNFCDQLSKPFFIGDSSSERANMVGEFAKTNIIDRAIKENASEIRNKKSMIKAYKVELKEIDEELLGYDKVDDLISAIEELKKLMSSIEDNEFTLRKINSIRTLMGDLENKAGKSATIFKNQKHVENTVAKLEELEALRDRASKINILVSKILSSKSRIKEIEHLISDKIVDDIKTSIEKCSNLAEIASSLTNIKRLKSSFESLVKRILKLNSILDAEELVNTVDSDFDKFEQMHLNYTKIMEKVADLNKYKERKNQGDIHIEILERKKQDKVNEYKQKLRDSKSCPICFSKTDEEHLQCIEDYI